MRRVLLFETLQSLRRRTLADKDNQSFERKIMGDLLQLSRSIQAGKVGRMLFLPTASYERARKPLQEGEELYFLTTQGGAAFVFHVRDEDEFNELLRQFAMDANARFQLYALSREEHKKAQQ